MTIVERSTDPPALARLVELELLIDRRLGPRHGPSAAAGTGVAKMGVEVFFVVSGYLITSLLLEEQGASGCVSLRNFWMRRARRLFPALAAMLVAVASWAVFWGSAEQGPADLSLRSAVLGYPRVDTPVTGW